MLDKVITEYERIVAVGECGLDYYRNLAPKNYQIACFKGHIQLAIKHNLPLFIHERDAFEDMIKILDEYKEEHIKIVIHCYTGNITAVKAYIDRGFYIGLTGWITNERRNSRVSTSTHS